jgi:hypothetical protein
VNAALLATFLSCARTAGREPGEAPPSKPAFRFNPKSEIKMANLPQSFGYK